MAVSKPEYLSETFRRFFGSEKAGGIMLILGVLTPVVAALLAADMLGAIFLVHFANGFSSQNGGYEYVLTLFAAAVALARAGPGAYALDRAIFNLSGSRS